MLRMRYESQRRRHTSILYSSLFMPIAWHPFAIPIAKFPLDGRPRMSAFRILYFTNDGDRVDTESGAA